MDPARKGFGNLGVDLTAKAGQAAERGLDMAAGAAEAIVEVEVPERGIEVVQPHQTDHAAAEPDAFRIAGRAADGLRRLDEFVGLALVVPVHIGRIGSRRFAGLVRGRGTALGENPARSDQEDKACNGEVAQNRIFEIRPTATHTFPDLFHARGIFPKRQYPRLVMAWLVAVQIGPQCGGDTAGFP